MRPTARRRALQDDPVREAELPPRPQQHGVAQLLALQQTAGNATVARLLQRRTHGVEPDAPSDETTALGVTGKYEAVDGGRDERVMLQLNQAGNHVTGWWQRHVGHGEGHNQTYSRFRLNGTIDIDEPDEVVLTYTRVPESGVDRTPTAGTLTVRRAGEDVVATVEEGSWTVDLARYDTRARLSDAALAAVPEEARDLVTAAETTPLDQAEEALLQIVASELKTAAAEYADTSQANITREVAAMNTSRLLGRRLSVFGAAQRPLVARRLRGLLLDEEIQAGEATRPVWDWLQVMVGQTPAPWTLELQNYLGLRAEGGPGLDAVQHKYRYMTSIAGLSGDVGVGLGGFVGVVVIQKLEPDAWSSTYYTAVGQVSAGPSVGVGAGQTSSWTEFETPYNWTSGNFAGRYTAMVGSGGGAFVAGAGYQDGMMIFHGDGALPELAAPADGAAVLYGAQAGAEAQMQVGYLWGGKAEAVRGSAPQGALETGSAFASGSELHFAVDDPSLNESGRQRLREMVASERAAFESSGSVLEIDGYASPSGPEARNTDLAELRAQNTRTAISDLLGGDLAIPAGQIRVRSHGEQAARDAGVPDAQEHEDWRRVEVRIDGRLAITLH